MKFYIEEPLSEAYEVDEKEFRETLNGLRELWGEECKVGIYENVANLTVTKTWIFCSTKMWLIAHDYKELKELGL